MSKSCPWRPLTSFVLPIVVGRLDLWTGVLYKHKELRSGIFVFDWLFVICVALGHSLCEPEFCLFHGYRGSNTFFTQWLTNQLTKNTPLTNTIHNLMLPLFFISLWECKNIWRTAAYSAACPQTALSLKCQLEWKDKSLRPESLREWMCFKNYNFSTLH